MVDPFLVERSSSALSWIVIYYAWSSSSRRHTEPSDQSLTYLVRDLPSVNLLQNIVMSSQTMFTGSTCFCETQTQKASVSNWLDIICGNAASERHIFIYSCEPSRKKSNHLLGSVRRSTYCFFCNGRTRVYCLVIGLSCFLWVFLSGL